MRRDGIYGVGQVWWISRLIEQNTHKTQQQRVTWGSHNRDQWSGEREKRDRNSRILYEGIHQNNVQKKNHVKNHWLLSSRLYISLARCSVCRLAFIHYLWQSAFLTMSMAGIEWNVAGQEQDTRHIGKRNERTKNEEKESFFYDYDFPHSADARDLCIDYFSMALGENTHFLHDSIRSLPLARCTCWEIFNVITHVSKSMKLLVSRKLHCTRSDLHFC